MDKSMDTSGPTSSSSSQMAQRRWYLENNVESVDGVYKYDREEQQMIRSVKPWDKDPHYFKVCFFKYFGFSLSYLLEVALLYFLC